MPSHQKPSWASGGEVTGPPMQENHSDCSGEAQQAWFWDLMAMSSQIPLSLPNLPNLLTQPSIRSLTEICLVISLTCAKSLWRVNWPLFGLILFFCGVSL